MKRFALVFFCFCVFFIFGCGDETIKEVLLPCGDGTTLKDGVCYPNEYPCAEGTEWKDGKCILKEKEEKCFPSKEICDNKDNDCDGEIDEDLHPLLGKPCEGEYGVCKRAGLWECYTIDSIICSTNPGGSQTRAEEEICGDKMDNNCNGEVDELCIFCYPDADGDGYITKRSKSLFGVFLRHKECPSHYVSADNAPSAFDCDDTDKNINPGKLEICDNMDNDCDGKTDESDPHMGQSCNALVSPISEDGVPLGPDVLVQGKITCGHYNPDTQNYITCTPDCQEEELCNDIVDNNCNWLVNEGCF